MKKYIFTICTCACLLFTSCGNGTAASDTETSAEISGTPPPTVLDELRTAERITSEDVAEFSEGFDGTPYGGPVTGNMSLRLTRLKLPPNTKSDKFITAVPSLVYVEEGEVSVVAVREDGKVGDEYQLQKGAGVGDSLNGVKFFVSGDDGAILLLFFAGADGAEVTRATETTPADSDENAEPSETSQATTAETTVVTTETTAETVTPTVTYGNFDMR